MGRAKIQDEAEVVRWFEEGRSYNWMVEEHDRKYHVLLTPSAFSNFRVRKGLSRRIAREPNLIPWEVNPEHRWAYPLAMLRVEARRRSGFKVRASDAERLESWKQGMAEDGVVVHYDPDTEQGWWYVPRRAGVDLDLIYEPKAATTPRGKRE